MKIVGNRAENVKDLYLDCLFLRLLLTSQFLLLRVAVCCLLFVVV